MRQQTNKFSAVKDPDVTVSAQLRITPITSSV